MLAASEVEFMMSEILGVTLQLTRILAHQIRVFCQQWTNSHRLQKSCGEKGQHGHTPSERERARFLPGQAFIAFLGTLHRGWSSFTVHRSALGGYLLQKTKERMLLIT